MGKYKKVFLVFDSILVLGAGLFGMALQPQLSQDGKVFDESPLRACLLIDNL